MKLNIANPATGLQRNIDFPDEKKLAPLYEKRIAQEVPLDFLGDPYKGYVVKITGGNDKQGFPMMQGVMANQRVHLLLDARHPCYRPKREGERKRKAVRGCIIGSDLATVSCIIVKRGEQEIPGLTDGNVPRRLGPKRANHIRKMFNLTKKDDVRKYVIRREVPAKKEGRKPISKAPKIQRLVTPVRLQRRRRLRREKTEMVVRARAERKAYMEKLAAKKAALKATEKK
eukprot:JZ551973.1.p1 GENE.JZ551973.1~~JZ551973.1.p1  ORF type:complete len:229 (+),score=97.21 JZ551973.1:23-709(+)